MTRWPRRLREVVLGDLSPADVLTISNGLMGFLAIMTFSIETGLLPGHPDAIVAAAFIGLGLVFDALDGPAARKWGGSDLGGDLDTLSDLITFVVAPAVFILEVYGPTRWTHAVFTAVLILVFGTLRLARFNSGASGESENRTFTGLPTPWCAISVVILILLDVAAVWALPVVNVLAVLMVSSVPYPKSRPSVTWATVTTAAVAALIILGLLFVPQLHTQLLLLSVAIALFAVAATPLLVGRGDDERGEGDADES